MPTPADSARGCDATTKWEGKRFYCTLPACHAGQHVAGINDPEWDTHHALRWQSLAETTAARDVLVNAVVVAAAKQADAEVEFVRLNSPAAPPCQGQTREEAAVANAASDAYGDACAETEEAARALAAYDAQTKAQR